MFTNIFITGRMVRYILMVNSKQIEWNLEQLLVPVTCGNRNDCEIFHVPKWKQATIEKELFCGSNVRDCLGSQSVATKNFAIFRALQMAQHIYMSNSEI